MTDTLQQQLRLYIDFVLFVCIIKYSSMDGWMDGWMDEWMNG